MITFVHTDEEFVKMYKFRTQNNHVVLVKEFENGVATIEPTWDYKNLEEFIEVISGCLNGKSNFKKELMKAYGHDENSELKGINIIILGINVFISPEKKNKDEIQAIIDSSMIKHFERNLREVIDSLFHCRYCDYITNIVYSTEIEFVSKEAERKWRKKTDKLRETETGFFIVDYADNLAKYIQYLVEDMDKKFPTVIDEAMEDIDSLTMAEGDTILEAIYLLVDTWKYGDELIKWNRKVIDFQMQSIIDDL